MAPERKPLFRPEALRPLLASFQLPPPAVAARPKVARWAALLKTPQAGGMKETELRDEFLYDVFRDLLGYTTPAQNPAHYAFKKEALIQVDGTYADAAFGRFDPAGGPVAVVLEGKGPNDPLDKPYKSRKRSAVEQAVLYALQLKVDWYLVTNLRETRLYCKRDDTAHFEQFKTADLDADEAELRRFVYLLGAERVAAPDRNHLDDLHAESKRIGRDLTAGYYREYRDLRARTFDAIRRSNPAADPRDLLAAAQKVLDRVLFIAFCEDRGLLPDNSIEGAYRHADPYNPRPVWENFKGLFRAVDRGNPALRIDAYNGGLFAPDPAVDALAVPDDVCEGFKKLAEYEYGTDYRPDAKLIDVEILGHIFEQSISDLEGLHQQITADPAAAAEPAGPSKRKREGAFYTPEYITRYIVAETLGPVLRERFEALRAGHEAAAARTTRKAFADPRLFDPADLTEPRRKALAKFWGEWLNGLEGVRVVDPACGSGAFLIEAFDQMFAEYQAAEGYLQALGSGSGLFEPRKTIITHNLFGVDLNAEAVSVARLSCWIKTAEKGKKLTALDRNIVRGNSVVGGPLSPLEAWRERFPEVFAAGGFDVVIGNPPYVRQEWITADKPYLKDHYRTYDGVADLYVYFYELGLTVLKPGGRLGYIVTNKWMKAGYGEALRTLYADAAWVESVVDLGHNKQIFPDADVFPCILTAKKPDAGPAPDAARVCVIPREQFRVDDLSRQIAAEGVSVPRARLGAGPWNLEPPGVAKLMDKLKAVGVPLKEFLGVGPYRGVLTGCNDAFIIDSATRDKLLTEDQRSEVVLKKYLRGQDIDRWGCSWSREWIIFARRGTDIDQLSAVKRHLEQYHTRLQPKPKDWTGDEWPGRKAGSYKWYELQDSTDYWREFEKPKLVWPDLSWRPSFFFDPNNLYVNDTTFFVTNPDFWALAALNSPAMWCWLWRNVVHGKDEVLRLKNIYTEQIPIPRPTDTQRTEAEAAVRRLIALTGERQAGRAAVTDWLRAEFGVEKASQKLRDPAGLDPDAFVAEVKKGGKKGLSVADVKRLRDEHAGSVVPLRALAREADGLERRVSDLVNAAYGLTPAEVALMWQTAPPRMPISPPTGA